MSIVLAAHLYIFGDSLSSPTGCEWPRHLQETHAIHNYAQAGLTLDAMDIPNHLRLRGESTVVIWAGSNDAGQQLGVEQTKTKLREIIKIMKLRWADQVIVMGLPAFIDKKYRKAIRKVASSERVTYVPQLWGSEATSDGIHPTCDYNRIIADDVRSHL